MSKQKLNLTYTSVALLLVWIVIGAGLRFANLSAKPPWIDEFATIVFSLGNSFQSVPLDQLIGIDVLLQPLQVNPSAGIDDVLEHLLTEDIHPPVYFILAHWWMKLWSGQDIVWLSRSISALFGVASIPAVYAVSRLAFRSVLIAHLAAAFIAVSPYGVFLSQEARHYTLAILWVIASVGCLVVTVRYIQQRQKLPWAIALLWVAFNTMGISTHYFFSLNLFAQALVLMAIAFQIKITPWSTVWRILAVAMGTAAGCLVWLNLFLLNRNTAQLTQWIQTGDRNLILIVLNPIFQSLAGWITMISLLPVESTNLAVIIASGLVMLIFFVWAIPILVRGGKFQLASPQNSLMTKVVGGVVVGAIAQFLIITYFFGIDLTRGARYNFVYFPVVMVLLGALMAACWGKTVRSPLFSYFPITGKKAVTIMWVMGFLSGITVVCNLGYRKYYRPDILVPLIESVSLDTPVLIATTHKSLVQTGEMMGIARELKVSNSLLNTKFLLAQQNQEQNIATATLEKILPTLPRPFDAWLVNFHTSTSLQTTPLQSCAPDTQSRPGVYGYEYKIYHCR